MGQATILAINTHLANSRVSRKNEFDEIIHPAAVDAFAFLIQDRNDRVVGMNIQSNEISHLITSFLKTILPPPPIQCRGRLLDDYQARLFYLFPYNYDTFLQFASLKTSVFWPQNIPVTQKLNKISNQFDKRN